MQAIILAAGLGTRMGELTKDTPKPLLKIKDKTILERNFASLPAEIDEVILVVSYLHEQIREFVGEEFYGKPVRYVVQDELKGTAYALRQCQGILKNKFLVLMGDDLYAEPDLRELVKHKLAVLVYPIAQKQAGETHSVVKINEAGDILEILERQKSKIGDLTNAGAYVLDASFFALPLVSAGDPAVEYGLPQTFMQMARKGARIKAVRARFWHRVVTPKDLEIKLAD